MNKKGLRNVFLVLIMLLVSIQILGCGGSGSKTASSYNVTAGAYIIELSSGKPATQPNAANEYKNFYGISWRGKASDNLRYAQNMSYKYVFYQQGAENYPDLSQFQFFFDGPLAVAMVGMSGLSTWGIIPSQTGTYSSTTNAFLKANAVWKNTNANNYPYNLASGCIFTQDRYMVNFDLQQDAVRKKVVDYCIQRVKNIQAKCPSIQFKGFAFDAPEITGEFHAWVDGKAKGVNLEYWTGKDSCVCPGTHNLTTYSQAMAQFFLDLKSAAKELNNTQKTIVEPYWIYDNWIGQIASRITDSSTRSSLIAETFASQEGGLLNSGTQSLEFYDDSRIFQFLDKSNVGCSTPDVHDEPGNRLLAARAAVNNSWFNWFGRFGGSGDGIDYNHIYEVPAWLKLVRMVANWDNLAGATGRSWNGTVYQSSNSFMDGHVIATRNPYTGKLFVVFLDKSGKVKLRAGESVKSVKRIDAYFGETDDGSGDLTTEVSSDQIVLGWK